MRNRIRHKGVSPVESEHLAITWDATRERRRRPSITTYRYEPVAFETLMDQGAVPNDLASTIPGMRTSYDLYRVTFESDGKTIGAIALLLPQSHRIAIAWKGRTDWGASTGDIEQDINDWLNMQGAWAR